MSLFLLKHHMLKRRVRIEVAKLLKSFKDPLDALTEAKVRAFEATEAADRHKWSRVICEIQKTLELQH